MKDCAKPLDPLDCEALASGEVEVSAAAFSSFGPTARSAGSADFADPSGPAALSLADAAAHAAVCERCGEAVVRARMLLEELDGSLEAPVFTARAGAGPRSGSVPVDLAPRILRIRPFSRREKRDPRLWAGPAGFAGLLFAAGAALLAAPGIGTREQAGLTVAVLAPLAGLSRAIFRALADAAGSPSAWQALSQAARQDAPLGFAALLLLAPAGFALRRVLVRAGRRG